MAIIMVLPINPSGRAGPDGSSNNDSGRIMLRSGAAPGSSVDAGASHLMHLEGSGAVDPD